MSETDDELKRLAIARALLGYDTPEDAFRLIGEFIYVFSHIEFSLRVILSISLKLDKALYDAVTAPYDFAALCRVTAVVWKARAQASNHKDIDRLMNELVKLNEDRVRVAHGTWTLSQDSSKITARHVSRTKLEASFYYKEPGQLRELVARANSLHSKLLNSTMSGDTTGGQQPTPNKSNDVGSPPPPKSRNQP